MCNPDKPDQVYAPTAQGRAFLLARHLLTELQTALADLAEAERIITRLEAGENRFACRRCGVTVWTTQTEPPPSWRRIDLDGPANLSYACQDCHA